jgi:hypothetical protein
LAAPIVEPGRADIRVAQPDLDFGDIGVMLKRISRGCGPQTVYAQPVNVDARRLCPMGHDLVDAVTRNGPAGGATADRAKQRAIARFALSVALQILMNALGRDRVQRQIAYFIRTYGGASITAVFVDK